MEEELIENVWIAHAEVNRSKWKRYFCSKEDAKKFASELEEKYGTEERQHWTFSVEVGLLASRDELPEIIHDDFDFPIWDASTCENVYISPQAIMFGDVVLASMNNAIVAFNVDEAPTSENFGLFATDPFIGMAAEKPKTVFYSPRLNRFVEDHQYMAKFYAMD